MCMLNRHSVICLCLGNEEFNLKWQTNNANVILLGTRQNEKTSKWNQKHVLKINASVSVFMVRCPWTLPPVILVLGRLKCDCHTYSVISRLAGLWRVRVTSLSSFPIGTSCMVSSTLTMPAYVFLLLRYAAVYHDLGDAGIITYFSATSIEVLWISYNTNKQNILLANTCEEWR